jgi:predicted ATP-grasp superfamily ATP-dependent carboligase
MNKKYQHEIARNLKIPVPKSVTVSMSNLDEIEKLDYPIIIKALTRNRFGQQFRLSVLNNNSDLQKFCKNAVKIIDKEFDILQASEVIPGTDDQFYSYLAYYHLGSPKGELVGRKIFQYPQSFGQASVAENQTDSEYEVKKLGRRLMQHLNYHGLVQIEFKFDKRDQTLKLIEINPRAWSWIRLATDSGVNLPLIQYYTMIGKRWPKTIQHQNKRYFARGDFAIRNTLKRTSNDLFFIIKNIARIGFSKFSIRDPLPEIMFLASKLLRMLQYKGADEEASLA